MVYMHHTFLIHSSADGHLGCFHVLAIINSAVMNIGVHVSLSDLVSSVITQVFKHLTLINGSHFQSSLVLPSNQISHMYVTHSFYLTKIMNHIHK